MDKYEFNIKVEQMKKQAKAGDYETAMKIADGIDWRRVQNVALLSLVSEIYEKNQEFGEAKNILLLAFEKAPIGKGLLYKLTELALQDNSVDEAEAYYREFYDLAPEDTRQYILRYLILKAKGAPLDQLIHSLETYTHTELDEKWMYELAELYHEAGRSEDCVKMCDNIMLMFGLGKYVDKAIDLKTDKEGQPLTQYQQSLIDNRDKYVENLKKVEEEYGTPDEPEIEDDGETGEEPTAEGEPAPEEDAAAETEPNAEEPASENEADNGNAADSENGPDAEDAEDSEEEKISIEEDTEPAQAETENTDEVPEDAAEIPEAAEDETVKPAAEEKETEEEKTEEPEAAEKEQETDKTPEVPEEAEAAKAPEKENAGAENFIIQGKTPDEGFSAAVEKLKSIHAETGVKNPVAKIKAGRLNELGVLSSKERMKGHDLIIEEAGDLSDKSISELLTLISEKREVCTILLVDNPMQIRKLTEAHPALLDSFSCKEEADDEDEDFKPVEAEEPVPETVKPKENTAEFHPVRKPVENAAEKPEAAAETRTKTKPVAKPKTEPAAEPETKPEDDPAYAEEELDIDDFANYATGYAKKIDCIITGKSMLALYERIEIMEEDGIKLTRKNAEALIEEAADKAEKPSLMKKLFSPKYDHDGLLILKEEDFIC